VSLKTVYHEIKGTEKKLFLINDDGSHIPQHQLLTFNILFPLLEDGGVYIIEDIETSYWTKGEIYGYKTEYGYRHSDSIIEIFKTCIDNVNSQINGYVECKVEHLDQIACINFYHNCIVIIKGKRENIPYRFAGNI